MLKAKKALLFGVLLVSTMFLVSCTGAGQSAKTGEKAATSLQIKGSDTMVNLSQAWAEEFMQKHKGAGIAVTGGGSGTGIAALINGMAQMANSSREIKPQEKADLKAKTGKDVKEYIVAQDGIAFIVNKNNPVKELTVGQLAAIYTGKVDNWRELGGPDEKIVVLAREASSGTHVFVKEHVMKNDNYRPDALLQTSSATIIKEVSVSKGAIGYVGLGYSSDQTRVIAVKKDAQSPAVVPSDATINNNTYPVSRPLYIFTTGEPEGVSKDFIAFVMSPEGQAIVKQMEFVPVK